MAKLTIRCLCGGVLIVAALIAVAVWVVRANSTIAYGFPDRGGVSVISRGGTGAQTAGYARVQPNSSNTAPSGVAIFGFRQSGVLVTEAGVPASPLIQSGRIYTEVNGPVNTGIAIANPNPLPATISFYFTDASGVDSGAGTKTLAANSKFAAFLNEPPFNGGSSVSGTLTFTSSVPVSVIAIRGFTNERSEFLITTLPVIDPTSVSFGSATIPHFADGAGWTTQLVLVNPGDSAITGTVQFFSQGSSSSPGGPLPVNVNGLTSSIFNYTIQRRSSVRLRTSGTPATTSSGSIIVTPSSGQPAPSSLVVFSFQNGGFTVSEAGVPALSPSTAFRLYVEASDVPASILTGVAIANPSSTPKSVTFELTPLAGGSPVLTGTETIPATGQIAKFLNQIQGMGSLPRPFKGILRIVSSDPIAVIGLRSRVNERGDSIFTTTSPVDETSAPATSDVFFSHLVDNGGYTTQFIVFSGAAGQQSSGQIIIYDQNGAPLDLNLGTLADIAVAQTDSPDPVAVRAPLTYSISVSNNGPAPATGVLMTDILPPGAIVQSAIPGQGSCASGAASALVCNLGGLLAGGTVSVTVTITSLSPARLTNTVTVTGNEDDSNFTNNQSVITTLAAAATDLGITQSAPPNCVLGGFPPGAITSGGCVNLPFTLNVSNSGAAPAPNVIVTDVLPTDPPSGAVVATRRAVVPSQGTCSAVNIDRFSCNLGLLAAGATSTINVFFDIDPTAFGRTIANNVSVTGDIIDTVPANNSTSAPMAVFPSQPEVDLGITPSWSLGSVTRGSPVILNVPLVNNGPSTATGVAVTTTFSNYTGTISIRSVSSTQGTCSVQSASVVKCNIGTLIRNAPQKVTIGVIPSSAGRVDAGVQITGNEIDYNSSNDQTSVTLAVN